MSGAVLQAQALDSNANVIDLTSFPTALSGVSYTVDNPAGTVTPTATTSAGLQANLVATANGVYNVSVVGTNVAGSVVTSNTLAITVTSVAPAVPVVVTLTLTGTAN